MSEALGYAASSAVLATFLMRSMVPLRLVAILSNVLFIGYGYLAHIHPVLVLHAALLPINVARLVTHSGFRDPVRAGRYRELAPANLGVRYLSLFILGMTAGSVGTRAFIHVALAFFDQFRRAVV